MEPLKSEVWLVVADLDGVCIAPGLERILAAEVVFARSRDGNGMAEVFIFKFASLYPLLILSGRLFLCVLPGPGPIGTTGDGLPSSGTVSTVYVFGRGVEPEFEEVPETAEFFLGELPRLAASSARKRQIGRAHV